ncbi:hypothetical protein XI08_29195 [Bradyrhizobium sp. CCBAU 11361]|nr:hypothetical protein [Bradyrhizobium sp. CCBAU 11361]
MERSAIRDSAVADSPRISLRSIRATTAASQPFPLLILRSALFARVSKDEGRGARPGPAWFETALARLLTMRVYGTVQTISTR